MKKKLLLFVTLIIFMLIPVIKVQAEACEDITNKTLCNWNDACDVYNINIKDTKWKCGPIECKAITDPVECNARSDCYYIEGAGCDGSTSTQIYNSLLQDAKGDPNGLMSAKTEFVCSDVKYLTWAWLLIRIAAPFIIILFGSLDFIKAVMASDEKKMKESRSKFIKRLIAFLLLIILPFVVQFIFGTMGTYGSENVCLVRCIATNNTSAKGCD